MPFKDRIVRLEYHRQYNVAWYDKNRDKHNTRNKIRIMAHKEALFDVLGRTCVRCGYSDIRALQFDHIDGDGRKDRKYHGSGMYQYYATRPQLALNVLQVLCANCNWIKREEDNECINNRGEPLG